MVEFENQMFHDIFHEDGLIIAARGLGIEQVLINLLSTYSDEGNLVLIIGTSPVEEEYCISRMKERKISLLPICVTSDFPVNSRSSMYLKGGCIFVTSRILVVDFLMERVPCHLITGIIIWKADRILESCQEAFILRLYRLKNKTGFIKALSSSPLSYTIGFCHVERVMKNLFVKKLYLWPRFRMEVSECLSKFIPEVIELHLQMTPDMKQVQMATLDLITSTLQELKLSNRAITFDEFCTENAISQSFDKMLKIQLDPIWHQLSVRSKQLVADLKVLRTILVFLTQYDSVTFYNLVNSLMTTEMALQSAGWMLLPAAESLIRHAKLRVFKDAKVESPKKNSQNKGNNTSKSKFEVPTPEVNPKWTTLSKVLDEVKETENEKEDSKCLIVTQDDKTANQLREYLDEGAEKILKRNFYNAFGAKYGLTMPPSLFRKKKEEESSTSSSKYQYKKVSTTRSSKRKRETDKKEEEEKDKEEEGKITLTQITKRYPPGEEKQKAESEKSKDKEIQDGKIRIAIHSLKDHNDPFKMTRILEEFAPDNIILYDSDLKFVRQVEVWQARHPSVQKRVFFLIYKGTVEEQIYLTSIKREKHAFEYLISEKVTMLIPEYAEGKQDDHPDLRRDVRGADELKGNQLTRKGGVTEPDDPAMTPPRVIVDMREFRSELPSILHRRGIDIDPVTIELEGWGFVRYVVCVGFPRLGACFPSCSLRVKHEIGFGLKFPPAFTSTALSV